MLSKESIFSEEDIWHGNSEKYKKHDSYGYYKIKTLKVFLNYLVWVILNRLGHP